MPEPELPILCDIHLTPMECVQKPLQFPDGAIWNEFSFKCTQPNCLGDFSPDHGYVDYRDGSLEPSSRNYESCGKGSHSMALVAAAENGQPEWHCFAPHWINLCEQEPPIGKDLQVLVVQTSGPGGYDIGYEDATLMENGWDFSGAPQYTHVVAWLESDRRVSLEELYQVPKTGIRF